MRLATILFALLMFFVPVATASDTETTTEYTTENNLNWVQDFLQKHVVSLEPKGVSASITSDGEIVRDSATNPSFDVTAGSKFRAQPDHHSSLNFEVLKVDSEGVTLKYASQFDHRSFGKDKISIDTGKIKLPYRSKVVTQP